MNSRSSTSTPPEDPWEKPWPAEDIESVGHCPVCGEVSRSLLHADLVDNAFRAAPGKWALWSCAKCRSAYLDPRPTPATIHRAYSSYYTHQKTAGKDDYTALSPLRKLRRRMVNGYTNWRFGTQIVPSNSFGLLAGFAIPSLKMILDSQYRHLPRRPKGGGYLLDVGCGDGSFLKRASTCGWMVVGLDPDPMAVANAARQGLTVYEGGIEYFDGKTELFDVITLSHVIEHVYDPVKVLSSCLALLKPGGQIWLETPNIDSFGHARFQKNWRGNETPRHLVLFNRHSLHLALTLAGFPAPQNRGRPSACAGMFQASFAMSRGLSPYSAETMPRALKLQAAMAALAERLLPARREFLILTSQKKAR